MDSTTCWRRWSSSIPQPRPGVGQRHNEREARHLHFALLADFEPKGGVARAYGAYRSAEGVSERALFVIDKNGVLAWSHCSPITMSPGADGILEALERLQKGSFFHQGQICLTGGRGSGCQVAETVGPLPLVSEATAFNLAVRLNVVRINPALRLYERLGFRVTHEDDRKFCMKRDADVV